MKRYVLTYGLVLGTILCINMIYLVNLCYNHPDFESNDLLGYGAMLITFSLIFIGVINYRNKQLHGIISFGEALKTSLLIALIGSTMYVGVWLFYYYQFVPDFMYKYTQHVLKEAVRDGAGNIELAAKKKEMADFKVMYTNPVMIILFTYAEVLPLGIVVGLISSLILKKKPAISA